MWGAIKVLIGEDGVRDRICAMDFEKASVNAIRHAIPRAAIAGRIFHLGGSIYRMAQDVGLSWKYQAGEEFRLRVKTLSALAFPPLEG